MRPVTTPIIAISQKTARRSTTIPTKNHFTVGRNAGYGSGGFNVRERHNERKNEEYGNGDIEPGRFGLNVHFLRHLSPDGTPETYEQAFNRLLEDGTVAKRGLKPDAKVFAELVFDVNTAYFDEHGGYDFAKSFYEEAYRMAVNEIGGEQYILSAVMHADERNKGLSEELGRDIYHYHLHVVYVPVVEKEVYYRKDMKDKEKAGKLKEVITQISHSKKWPIKTPVERDGKTIMLNSYALLQDRYFEHMREAGFVGFERGERGSTREHLETLDYKIQQDAKRLEKLSAQVEKKDEKSKQLDGEITVKEKAKATIAEVEKMGKSLPLVPGVHLTDDEAKKLKSLAKKGVGVDKRADGYKKRITDLEESLREKDGQISDWKQSYRSVAQERDTWKKNYERIWAEVKEFIGIIRSVPNRLRALIMEHLPGQGNHDREVSR
jgi:flagellar biosynthesis chaperone FliJ